MSVIENEINQLVMQPHIWQNHLLNGISAEENEQIITKLR